MHGAYIAASLKKHPLFLCFPPRDVESFRGEEIGLSPPSYTRTHTSRRHCESRGNLTLEPALHICA